MNFMVEKWVTVFLQFKNAHYLFPSFAYYDWDMVGE